MLDRGEWLAPRMDEELHHPHDVLVRTVFRRPASAAAFLRRQVERIDPDLAGRLEWGGLALQTGSFVDAELKALHSDFVFAVPLQRQKLFLYCLVEHQSRPERFMAFRLLSYLVAFWKQWWNTHPKATTLPMVLPLVFYTGKLRWNASTRFSDLIDVPAGSEEGLRVFCPDFAYLLTTLSEKQGERAGDEIVLRTMMTLMEAVTHGRAEDWLDRHARFLVEVLQQSDGREVVSNFLRYLHQAKDGPPLAKITQKLFELKSKPLDNVVMNAAEELMLMGRKQGREEGREEGLRRGLLVGEIKAFQQFLAQVPTPDDVLQAQSFEELDRFLQELRRQVLSQR